MKILQKPFIQQKFPLSGSYGQISLMVFMAISTGHLFEHFAQMKQIFICGLPRSQAGGVLGLWFPTLAASEVLHTTWNTLQLVGLLLLWPLFKGLRAGSFWKLATGIQVWHWFEHLLLQTQYLSGLYLFGGAKPTSVLELFFPRADLHFTYNLLVFIPTVVALLLYVLERQRDLKEAVRG